MIVNERKLLDMQARALILECMEIAVRTGHLEDAKELGKSAHIIGERIKRYV